MVVILHNKVQIQGPAMSMLLTKGVWG